MATVTKRGNKVKYSVKSSPSKAEKSVKKGASVTLKSGVKSGASVILKSGVKSGASVTLKGGASVTVKGGTVIIVDADRVKRAAKEIVKMNKGAYKELERY